MRYKINIKTKQNLAKARIAKQRNQKNFQH
jgi:hypothetical protein